ncbi:MrcB family domain-containing protein [Cohnella thailandensis]|uniref:DUF3578 domain-containing protein n=1 Tax=Cohnella thailandensis TaxID=557557 RepID=A0A841T0D6_9BACL|nr:DUF3578 domain-containing protein [Cohnella thailandensis]MBB6637614.1 DUF3578 domain-containing protein [Cohnella thailandensis]MBP1974210.1 MoxR-like ATPase [Cohnella thailandensis]
MALSKELATIFRVKQKSYKMVLVLAMIKQSRLQNIKRLSLNKVAELFIKYYTEASAHGLQIDVPPAALASNWNRVTLAQAKIVMKTPIDALSSIIECNQDEISFKPHIWAMLDDTTLIELEQYALTELEDYNNQLAASSFSLKDALSHILNQYQQAKAESFSNHELGTYVRRAIPDNIKVLPFLNENYRVQGSVGQGNWATIPWIAILDKRITETTQHGEYIVYLFAEDMNSVYLTFNQGVTKPTKELGRKEGYRYLERKVEEMRSQLPLKGMRKDSEIELTSSGLGKDYQVSTVAYIRYDRDHIPADEQLLSDLQNMVENYRLYVENGLYNTSAPEQREVEEKTRVTLSVSERIAAIQSFIKNKGFSFPNKLLENFYLSLKTKPFVILAGVSGTGKTKLIKLFAEALGATSSNGQFTLIPVRPDWSDPSDLLGYKDLSGVFRPGRLTEVLVGASQPSNQQKPYFICLDEMNLARVEHYFSDLLSIIETQEWRDDRIVTNSFFHLNSLQGEDQLRYGNLHLPDNVYLIGTVNMDETTHPFSKKVLDRANTIEFNYINLEQYPDLDNSDTGAVVVQAPNEFMRSDYLQLVDLYKDEPELIKRATEKLVKVNEILEKIHSHVGFRIRDAICFYLAYNQRFELLTEDEAFDLQLLQKILPRVQGSNLSVKRVLLELMGVALDRTIAADNYLDDSTELYQEAISQKAGASAKYPNSARKIAYMLRRLEEDGFTSYWLS